MITAAVLLTIGIVKARKVSQRQALKTQGREVNAIITGVKVDEIDGEEVFSLEYTFTTWELGPNVEVEGEHRVGEAFDLPMMVGKEATVLYLPSNPKVSKLLTWPGAETGTGP